MSLQNQFDDSLPLWHLNSIPPTMQCIILCVCLEGGGWWEKKKQLKKICCLEIGGRTFVSLVVIRNSV